MPVFDQLAILEHEDSIGVQDGVQAMSDRQHRAVELGRSIVHLTFRDPFRTDVACS
eukprot:SAG25_NODE_6263_length_573_cov_1.409283_1_plen_55_part_10